MVLMRLQGVVNLVAGVHDSADWHPVSWGVCGRPRDCHHNINYGGLRICSIRLWKFSLNISSRDINPL